MRHIHKKRTPTEYLGRMRESEANAETKSIKKWVYLLTKRSFVKHLLPQLFEMEGFTSNQHKNYTIRKIPTQNENYVSWIYILRHEKPSTEGTEDCCSYTIKSGF